MNYTMEFCEDFDFSAVCRTCLGTEDLNPLFKKTAAYPKRFSKTMLRVTGLKVGINDGLPQNICKACLHKIKTAIAFQKNCKKAEHKLKMQGPYIEFLATTKDLHPNKDRQTDQTEVGVSSDVKEPEVSDISDVIVKTESPEEEFQEIDTDVLNLLPIAGILNEDEVDVAKEDFMSSVNEVERNDSVKLGESVDDEIKREDYREIKCEFCQQQFSSQDMLVQHIPSCKSAMEVSEQKIPSAVWGKETVECNICSKKLQRASLKLHTKIKHAGLGPICDVSSSKKLLYICSKKLQRASLKLHTKIKHAGLGPICDHCGKKFSNKFRLNEHMRSKHGFAKFKCSQCEFQSATTVAMANHERRHRGDKPYVCEVCGASFHAAYLLTQHKQSHRTERLLKCDMCPASFKSNNGLHTHRAACHGVTRHTCPECERVYSCRHYLVRHMRTVHHYQGAVPYQGSWADNPSDRQLLLPTAGNNLLAVHMRAEPRESWIPS